MNPSFWLNKVPIEGVFCLTVAIVLASIWIGALLGRRTRNKPGHEGEASLGTIIAAMLGLLAFMLAFTFSATGSAFENRRHLLLNETNAIGTVYLRSQLLPEPHKSQMLPLLLKYVDIRVNLAKSSQVKPADFQAAVSQSEALQGQMWSHAVALAESDRHSVIYSLFINSLNEMIDLQTSRITVFRYHLPAVIWYSLYFITITSMVTLGYQFGLSGKRVLKMSLFVALTFSAVIFLIADLDRASEGKLRVSQQPMFELQQKLQTTAQEAR
jgi:hypothetical protein